DYGRDVQVALARRRRPNANRLIRKANVFEVAVGSRVHGHGLDAQLAAGAQYAQSDFAAVGDDDFFQHRLKIRFGVMRCSALLDDEQRLIELDWLTVLYQYRSDHAVLVALDLVEHLHRFDNAQRIVNLDTLAFLDKRLGARRGCAVEGADHRRTHAVPGGDGRFGGCLVACGRCRRGCHRSGSWAVDYVRLGGRSDTAAAADANRLFPLFDLDFVDAGFFQQLDQAFDLADIHRQVSLFYRQAP